MLAIQCQGAFRINSRVIRTIKFAQCASGLETRENHVLARIVTFELYLIVGFLEPHVCA